MSLLTKLYFAPQLGQIAKLFLNPNSKFTQTTNPTSQLSPPDHYPQMSAVPLTILTEESQKLMADIINIDPTIKPITIATWKYMCLCFDTPRPSAKEDLIRSKLIECAKILGLEYKTDAVGNLAIIKPASPGLESKANIVIQAHMDMVTSKSDNSTHNFDTDRIPAKVSDDKRFVLSGETTLGADNGIGVAGGLALLEEAILHNIPLPQIELLFTTEEETTMRGALEASPDLLNNPTVCINCDSEEHKRVCLGCAGGGEVKSTKVVAVDTITLQDSGYAPMTIVVGGFNGGHSGVDIARGRGNAILVMLSKLLPLLTAKFGDDVVRIAGISGGNAVNAIPRNCTVTALVTEDQLVDIKKEIEGALVQIQDELALSEAQVSNPEITDKAAAMAVWKPTYSIEAVTGVSDKYNVMTAADQAQLFSFAKVIPHGVIDWSIEVPGFVETSNSFSIVDLANLNNTDADKTVLYHAFFRSTKDQALDTTADLIKKMATDNGFTATDMFNGFPGWVPRSKENPLFKVTEQAYQTVFSEDPAQMESYVIHAGLESGCINKVWPQLIQVSIGPTILDAHSFYEKIEISTVEPFCDWLLQIVKNLANVERDAFSAYTQ